MVAELFKSIQIGAAAFSIQNFLSRQALKQVGQTYNLVHLDLDLVLFFGNIPREKYSSAKIRSENDSLPLFSIS